MRSWLLFVFATACSSFDAAPDPAATADAGQDSTSTPPAAGKAFCASVTNALFCEDFEAAPAAPSFGFTTTCCESSATSKAALLAGRGIDGSTGLRVAGDLSKDPRDLALI